MAFRLIGQFATETARFVVRVPKYVRGYCQQIPLGPEGDYRREVDAFHYGFVAVGAPYIIWAIKERTDMHKPVRKYLKELNRKNEMKMKEMEEMEKIKKIKKMEKMSK